MQEETIIIDASGAPEGSGGMQLYVRELITGWATLSPQTEKIVIFGPLWLKKYLRHAGVSYTFITWPNKKAIFRIIGQIFIAPIIFTVFKGTKFLALSAVASPLIPAKYITVVNLDWRHLKNPYEFSKAQILYRHIWKISGQRAANVIAISQKTLVESVRILNRNDVIEVSLGGNHPEKWTSEKNNHLQTSQVVVTFGHHTNKRPWLVISAFLKAIESQTAINNCELVVLGFPFEKLTEDQKRIISENPKKIRLPGFVSDLEYQKIIREASLIIMASSDEGFGIPAVEAGFFGIPCLVSNDSGLREIHGNKVTPFEPEINVLPKK